MQEVKTFKQSELVLKVGRDYDAAELDLGAWEPFLDRLCNDRTYQKEAIRTAVIYLASGQYASLRDLAFENYGQNPVLKDKYPSWEQFLKALPMADKLYGTVDLATGTGKSYVIYGIAQIALGLGLVKRVLVLCPSLTIKSGLTEKFRQLSGDVGLKALIPQEAVWKSPGVVSANKTVAAGELCVENIHAVYENTGSSISDSFRGSGADTLVLSDEAHHMFNKASGRDSGIRLWRKFLLSEEFGFRYMLGFTGTAYVENEYFPDVLYRYSLRQAIEDRVVKNVDYVQEDESQGDNERFQKIYRNHRDNKEHYPLVKPLSILVTRDISSAKRLYKDFVAFLSKWENKPLKDVESKVLVVTSAREHRANVRKLKYVDEETDSTEWIISVSMLTEGWDVQNVFQVVPWEDRAFNSRLLIAQVLGRGLRVPQAYRIPQPKVVVFNHRAWSSKIKELVDEILEIEARIYSSVLTEGRRSAYHFTLRNIDYRTEPTTVEKPKETQSVDFTRLMKEGIVLESQSVEVESGTTYVTAVENHTRERNYAIRRDTWTIDEVIDRLYDDFETREWEGKTLKLGEDAYTKNALPPRKVIEEIIRFSMERRGNYGDAVIESNVRKILSAFTPLLRKNKNSIVSRPVAGSTFEISTKTLAKQSTSVGMIRQDRTVFLTGRWEKEIPEEEQRTILAEVLEDESFPRSATKEINFGLFKTPVTTVITASKPERRFVDFLCRRENAALLSAWVKSRDKGFYEIDYTCRYGSGESKTRKYYHDKFNPDFFLKVDREGRTYFLVVEIKDDGDASEENKAKYKYALQHFTELNRRLETQGIPETYICHFLSPASYDTFFQHLREGSVFSGQERFRSDLENLLEES